MIAVAALCMHNAGAPSDPQAVRMDANLRLGHNT
jgi:hypothetical protein